MNIRTMNCCDKVCNRFPESFLAVSRMNCIVLSVNRWIIFRGTNFSEPSARTACMYSDKESFGLTVLQFELPIVLNSLVVV